MKPTTAYRKSQQVKAQALEATLAECLKRMDELDLVADEALTQEQYDEYSMLIDQEVDTRAELRLVQSRLAANLREQRGGEASYDLISANVD